MTTFNNYFSVLCVPLCNFLAKKGDSLDMLSIEAAVMYSPFTTKDNMYDSQIILPSINSVKMLFASLVVAMCSYVL